MAAIVQRLRSVSDWIVSDDAAKKADAVLRLFPCPIISNIYIEATKRNYIKQIDAMKAAAPEKDKEQEHTDAINKKIVLLKVLTYDIYSKELAQRISVVGVAILLPVLITTTKALVVACALAIFAYLNYKHVNAVTNEVFALKKVGKLENKPKHGIDKDAATLASAMEQQSVAIKAVKEKFEREYAANTEARTAKSQQPQNKEDLLKPVNNIDTEIAAEKIAYQKKYTKAYKGTSILFPQHGDRQTQIIALQASWEEYLSDMEKQRYTRYTPIIESLTKETVALKG